MKIFPLLQREKNHQVILRIFSCGKTTAMRSSCIMPLATANWSVISWAQTVFEQRKVCLRVNQIKQATKANVLMPKVSFVPQDAGYKDLAGQRWLGSTHGQTVMDFLFLRRCVFCVFICALCLTHFSLQRKRGWFVNR